MGSAVGDSCEVPQGLRRTAGTEALMEPNTSTTEQTLLDELRRRRAELLDSMRAVEQALAAPTPGRQPAWAKRVHAALIELAAEFREHINITEGRTGLYGELLVTAPRLHGAVARLIREHALIKDQIDDLVAAAGASDVAENVDEIRELATTLLARLLGHRQRGSDLIFEAYHADIGGET
jgi:Hemerythrin HHE cation binding domain